MRKIISKIVVAMLICLLPQIKAVASSHREAPLISHDPQADNTDLYVFRSPADSSKVIIIANYIPFEHPAGGPNWYTFGQNIRYEIHIKNKTTTTGDDIIYRFTFNVTNQDTTTFFNIRLGQQNTRATYTCSRSMDGGSTFTTIKSNGIVPPANIGPRSIESGVGLGAANYDSVMLAAITTASTGEKLFCGPVDDPFFVDLGGAFDVGGFRHMGLDGLAKFNCHTIALEIPIATLQKDGLPVTSAANILDPNFIIGVWASASRPAISTLSSTGGSTAVSGAWTQVSRIGMPLTNEVIIPVGDKDGWNRANPYSDDLEYAANFKNPELGLYMDNSLYGPAVPGLDSLRIQSASLGSFDFRNFRQGLWPLKGSSAVAGTALDDAAFGTILLPDSSSPRAVDLLPIFYTGVPNLPPYQLATGKSGNPLAAGKPFINNFLPTLCDMIRLNMAVPTTPRNDPHFSSLGLISAAVLGLTDATYNSTSALQFIPNMDGFPNGRRLEDDVTTIELQAVSGVVLAAIGLWYDDYSGTGSPVTPDLVRVLSFDAGVTHNDTTFKSGFPFVQTPWRGFTGSQYTGPMSYTYYNVPPAFTGGTSQSLSVCTNSSANSINTVLSVIDSNAGQTETWSTFASPSHGTLSASYTTTSTGAVLVPTGLTYTPAAGYSGADSFKVKVTDGNANALTTIHVTVGAVSAITGSNSVCVGASTTLSNAAGGGTWTSSNTSIATISSSGVLMGVAAGSATITYTAGTGCFTTLAITVKPLPAAISGASGLCIGNTATFTDPTSGGLSWTSSNTSIVTIGATSGVATGMGIGMATITYTLISGCTATKSVSVNAVPAAFTGSASVCAGSTTTLSSADAGGVWSTSNASVATIGSSTGIVTGVATGTTIVSYNIAGCARLAIVTVNASPAPITGATSICTGSTAALSTTPAGGTWASSATSVATVNTSGIVTGLTTGTSLISYSLSSGCARIVTVSVGAISPITGATSVCIGLTSALSNATSGGTWSTSNAIIATVTSGGTVTGVAAGMANITYAVSAGCRAIAMVTVTSAPAAITGTSAVCIGNTTALSSATSGGTWSSSNAALGSVNATGVVTGISAGTPVITYSLGTACFRTLSVMVKPLPAAIAGNAAICVGTTSTLTDPTPSGMSWTSSMPSVATIGVTSGVLSGVSVGTTTITFTLTSGCTATRVATVNPGLSPGTITGPNTVSIAASMSSPVAYTDAVTGGTWTTSNNARATIGSSSGLLTGVSAGNVTITYTVSNTCQTLYTTKMITITSPRGGVDINEEGTVVRLYPNPTSGSFTLQSSADGSLIIYTLEGKQLAQYSVIEGTNALSLPKGIAPGVYMCRYNGNDGSTLMVRLIYEQ